MVTPGALSTELAWAVRHFDFDQLLDPKLLQNQRALNANDVFKIDKIVRDISLYLAQAAKELLRVESTQFDMESLFEGRSTVLEILSILGEIDLFVSKLLLLPLILQNTQVVLNLKRVTLLLIGTKQTLLALKRKTDLAGSYIETRDHIIDGLSTEISRLSQRLGLLKASSYPTAESASLNFDDFMSKIRLGSLTNYTVRSATLPVLSEAEQDLFADISALETSMDPIHVSMEFLRQRVFELTGFCGSVSAKSAKGLTDAQSVLQNSWENLLKDFSEFKHQTSDLRWVHTFAFMMSELLERIQSLTHEFEQQKQEGNNPEISDEFGSHFKLCSNAITLAHKAFKEGVITDKGLSVKYNSEVLPSWEFLNVSLSERSPFPTSPLVNNDLYRPLKTRIHTPQAAAVIQDSGKFLPNSPSWGIDLRLDVNPSPSVPYSISKKDRIIDLSIDPDLIPKSNMRLALLGLSGLNIDTFDDDTATLVHDSQSTGDANTEKAVMKLLKAPHQPSRIPTIVPNYNNLTLPVIKKMFMRGYKPTRIPSISATHPVFLSPQHSPQHHVLIASPYSTPQNSNYLLVQDRLPWRTCSSPDLVTSLQDKDPYEVLRSPPVFDLRQIQRRDSRSVSWDEKSNDAFHASHSLSRGSSTKSKLDKVSLTGIATPNLAYGGQKNDSFSPDAVSLRSTSPERPGLSMGLRFDERNLMQPIKLTKRQWR